MSLTKDIYLHNRDNCCTHLVFIEITDFKRDHIPDKNASKMSFNWSEQRLPER